MQVSKMCFLSDFCLQISTNVLKWNMDANSIVPIPMEATYVVAIRDTSCPMTVGAVLVRK